MPTLSSFLESAIFKVSLLNFRWLRIGEETRLFVEVEKVDKVIHYLDDKSRLRRITVPIQLPVLA